MKKVFCYIWDPDYNEGLNPESPQMDDGMSVGNPEAKISQTPAQAPGQSTASSDTASNTETDSEDMESDIESDIDMGTDAQVNFQRHRAGTVKRPTQENDQINSNDNIIISPFAVCGGNRVGSLRQIFNPPNEKNKKKSIRKATVGSLDVLGSRPGSLRKPDPALKVGSSSESSVYISYVK